MQFVLGSNAATSVTFNIFTVTARGAADGFIYAKAGDLATTAGQSENLLTYSNSFLTTWPQTFGTIDPFITGAGWTQLYSDTTLNGLGATAGAHNFTSTSSSSSALLNFYNANLGQTITILFGSRAPVNGNNVTWSSREGASGGASLSVVETPEPATLALLMVSVPWLAKRSRRAR